MQLCTAALISHPSRAVWLTGSTQHGDLAVGVGAAGEPAGRRLQRLLGGTGQGVHGCGRLESGRVSAGGINAGGWEAAGTGQAAYRALQQMAWAGGALPAGAAW